MAESDRKADLREYLQAGREALLWKVDGLAEYDARRPLTPTGTNLLGLVKHLACVEAGSFGDTFGRPFPGALPWDESDPNSDMFVAPDESREFITELYRRVWTHSDATIEVLDLDALGNVPWWPAGRNPVTLHHMLVRIVAETSRHAGHADILREQIDGMAGLGANRPSLPSDDQSWWAAHYDRVERAAREAAAASETNGAEGYL
ncbi:MAG TPA: DinB family protein [Trebonia sp.]|nr:DinB family protein [Trebonia sp.]